MDLVMLPFRLALKTTFRGLSQRTGILLRGERGWGEFSPFADYDDAATARWLECTLEGTERGWPEPLRRRIPVNVTVPALAPAEAHRLVSSSGCSTAKVKVGDVHDEARVEAVRDALGPRGRIRIDVNGGWDVEEARRKISALARYDLEYVEQPVSSVDDMALLRRRVQVRLAADESIRRSPDPREVVRKGAADVAVLKAHPLGGVRRALRLYEDLGLPAVVSSALESSVGMQAGLALAAALPELPYACGLASTALFEDDVVDTPLLPQDGFITLRAVEPKPDVAQPSDEDTRILTSRLERALQSVRGRAR